MTKGGALPKGFDSPSDLGSQKKLGFISFKLDFCIFNLDQIHKLQDHLTV